MPQKENIKLAFSLATVILSKYSKLKITMQNSVNADLKLTHFGLKTPIQI